ncbi:lipopolysaccharide biosynthesis protein [Undibacterium sp. Dicai25W]|uniref:lipopolysaccharide biosynthesis protein n=1 Tax=Undibacterium sp. Dicai25W TaxID=3413034 RepID=UPI003BF34BBA
MLLQLLRSGAVYGLANVMAAGVPFMLLPVLTRALSPTEYGEVVSFFMLVSVATAMAGLSLHGAVGVRWLDSSKGDPRGYTRTAMLLVIFTTILTTGLAALLGPVVGINLSAATCGMAAVLAGCMALQGMRFAVWQSCNQALPAAALQVVSAVLGVAFSLAAVLLFGWGSIGRIGGAVVAGLAIAGFSVLSLSRLVGSSKPSYVSAAALLRFGVPLIPHAMAGALLGSLDRFAVSAQLGTETLGVYGAASQLGLVINVLADAVTKAFTPQMYRMLARNTARDRLRVVALSYLSVPAWLLMALALWAMLLVGGGVLLGAKYLAAIDLTIWFLLGGALTGAYLNVAGLFFFTSKTEWISVATLTACGITAVLAPWAVANYGVLGAALSYCASQATLLLAVWLLSVRVKPMPWQRPVLALRVLARSWRAR